MLNERGVYLLRLKKGLNLIHNPDNNVKINKIKIIFINK